MTNKQTNEQKEYSRKDFINQFADNDPRKIIGNKKMAQPWYNTIKPDVGFTDLADYMEAFAKQEVEEERRETRKCLEDLLSTEPTVESGSSFDYGWECALKRAIKELKNGRVV